MDEKKIRFHQLIEGEELRRELDYITRSRIIDAYKQDYPEFEGGTIYYVTHDGERIKIFVEAYGIWDTYKATFVD